MAYTSNRSCGSNRVLKQCSIYYSIYVNLQLIYVLSFVSHHLSMNHPRGIGMIYCLLLIEKYYVFAGNLDKQWYPLFKVQVHNQMILLSPRDKPMFPTLLFLHPVYMQSLAFTMKFPHTKQSWSTSIQIPRKIRSVYICSIISL